MRRGTTPTHIFTVQNSLPVGSLNKIWITYSQVGKEIITKDESDVVKDTTNNNLSVTLTQADTLKFAVSMVSIQIRATVGDKALASNIITAPAEKILRGGTI